jgi:septal ring factor EnvC (AmiA/AmiB activator)
VILPWARLAVAALACLAFPLPAADNERLETLRLRIERLRNEIAGGEESRAEASDQLRESERAISEANRALRELARKRDGARAELASLNTRQGTVLAEIAARQQRLGRLLTALYLGGEHSNLKLLVMGEDPNQVARELQYYGYVSRAQAVFIKSLRADLGRLRAIEASARDKTAELSAIESEQRSERGRLLGQQAERRRVLDRVSAQLRDQRREVKNLERDEARLSRLVDRLTKVIAAPTERGRRNERVPVPAVDGSEQSSFAQLKGKLRLPIKGELVNRFGARRSEGGPQWKGLFIRAASGQDVRVVAAGRVVFAEWMRGFGNLLIVDHGAGYLTIYGNNESVLKAVGEQVRTGDVVATAGATGGSPESGLYFEIRRQGKPFDPLKWVSLK